jgi:hypothetical protein
VGEINDVVKGVPPNTTLDPFTKPLPPTDIEKLPTGSKVGLTVWGTGIGTCTVTALEAEREELVSLVA